MTADQVEEKSRRRRRRSSAEDADIENEEVGLTEGKGRATPGRRSRRGVSTQDEGNFITRPLRGIVEYFSGVRDEMRKVTWPTREELQRLTVIVTIVTVVSSLVLGAIAFAFTELFILGFENEIVFIIAGVLGVIAYFGFGRLFSQQDEELRY